jgi:uncharacterized protein YndB with AHSA1/START domain
VYSTRISRRIAAPRAAVYRALTDPAAIAQWRVPDGMRSQVHEFDTMVPDEQMIEVFEFETADPGLAGQMAMTTTLTDVDGGTEVLVVHDGVPDSVPPADNETGTRMALDNLARLVETGAR